jgi:ubiquitin C-terminal hydrolase
MNDRRLTLHSSKSETDQVRHQLFDKTTAGNTDLNDKRKSVTVLGLSGLRNIGNTCYMNSVLQSLSHTRYLHSYLRKKEFDTDLMDNVTNKIVKTLQRKHNLTENIRVPVSQQTRVQKYKESVTYQLYHLLKAMWLKNCTVTPESFKDSIGNISASHKESFKDFSQKDGQELLGLILDNLHEDTKTSVTLQYKNITDKFREYYNIKKKYTDLIQNTQTDEEIDSYNKTMNQYNQLYPTEYVIYKSLDYWKKFVEKNHSVIIDIFTGLFYTNTHCNECGTDSPNFAPYNMIQLELPDTNQVTDLTSCLKKFSEGELLTGENKYKCDNCDKLVDAIKTQYLWNSPEVLIIHLKRFKFINPYRTEKIYTKVAFPLNGLTLENNFSDIHRKNPLYNAYAIIQHHGVPGGGHYVAYCKNAINNKWYEFNDSTVVHIPDEELEREVVTRNAYVIFYEKVNKTSPMTDSDSDQESSNTDQ